ncbi:hypothetical protein [Actinomadura algeriensis]|uniref:Uncharacterized protein n=1 Tax=Actinomadura algeriensis TaxID=1679523 RepID=A0ABR9JIZ4_9ACTN|nr:hypothetical protein [Actinomadura algeriensis]MBE1530526.1 hypothetical protein [Actinomadura algeriensis]
MGRENLPRLTETGELLLADSDGGTVRIDLFRTGGLGVGGAGSANAMYALLAGLLSSESYPEVHIVGTDEDLSLLTGLPIRHLSVPGPPGLTSFATHADVLRHLRTDRRTREDGPPRPFLLLFAFAKEEVYVALPEIIASAAPERQRAAILIPVTPVGHTCTIDRDGNVLDVRGPDEDVRSLLRRGRFAQLDIDEVAELFNAHLIGVIARYEAGISWPDLPS